MSLAELLSRDHTILSPRVALKLLQATEADNDERTFNNENRQNRRSDIR